MMDDGDRPVSCHRTFFILLHRRKGMFAIAGEKRAKGNVTQARLAAANALLRVEKGGYSNIVIDNALGSWPLEKRDKAFAAALFYGVLERSLTLDAVVAALCPAAKKLHVAVVVALRCGLYQLLYMPGVPAFAAVNQSVELVKELGQPRAGGLVNGVLQSFLRGGKSIPLPQSPPAKRLSIAYSVPEDLCALWLTHYGEAAARQMLERSLGQPPVYLRVNTTKTDSAGLAAALAAEGIAAAEGPIPHSLLLLEGVDLRASAAYEAGLFHVQDISSQLCALAVGARPGMRVLDSCAAPGGKSFTLAEMMEDKGEIVAMDLHESRVALVARGAERLGLGAVRAVVGDASQHHKSRGVFDRVLCDVPCSGFGIIRRKPEIRYKTLASVADLPNVQYNILEMSSKYIQAGGMVIYSTCTLNPLENEEVIARFLVAHPDFAPGVLPEALGGGSSCTLGIGGEETPDCDGFFIGAVEKRGHE